MLSTSDAETLNAARKVLADLERAAPHSFGGETLYDGFDAGVFAAAAENAGGAIFRVLNVADAYLHDPVASLAIREYWQ